MSFSNCLLSVGQMVLIKCTSNTLLLRMFTGALLMIVHVNLWVSFSFKCLTGSDLLFLSLSSTNVSVKNIYSDKDTSFRSHNSLRTNKNIVVLAACK